MRQVPGPAGTPVWGSFQEFRSDPTGFLLNAADTYGDVIHFRFAHQHAYLLSDPDLIKDALVVQAGHFDKATRSAGKIRATCGESLLSVDQPTWERHRRLIQPVFQPKFIASMDAVIDAATHSMLERWDGLARDGEPIDLVSEMTHLVIDISGQALFASDVDPTRLEAALTVLLDDTWRRLQAPIDLADLSSMFHRKATKSALSEIDETVFRIIAGRRNDDEYHDDVLSRLLAAHEAGSGTGLSDRELRDAVITLLLAGHETTANALGWAFFLLAREPEKIPEDGNFENVFRETLRLYPSIWIIERRIREPTVVGGYDLNKGASLLVSPYVLHRLERYWDQPEVFNPDRFGTEQSETRPRNAYLPFGLGQHRCVGLHFASSIATRVLSTVCARFRLTLLSDGEFPPDPGITLRHKHKIHCSIETLR